MRPLRLELEGFASYRDRTVVDFTGVDLFALTGPTGAGKSTILDAIVFALYGIVPRYDDKRAVAPVISQSRQEARVSLEFSIGGDQYLVVRGVRRRGNVVSTFAAKFEKNGVGLAANERGVTEAAEKALGLDFDQFTKCVLLPQGEFARFLHDSGQSRIELLRKLLGIDVYERLRRAANDQATLFGNQVLTMQGRLQAYAEATPERLKDLQGREKQIEQLLADVDKGLATVEVLKVEATGLTQALKDIGEAIASLKAVEIPPGVADIAARQEAAQAALKQAIERREQAHDAVRVCEEDRAKRRPTSDIEREIRMLEECDRLAREVEELSKDTNLEVQLDLANQWLTMAEATTLRARQAKEHLQRQLAGLELASQLRPGDPCPVCGAAFHAIPTAPPAEWPATCEALDKAEKEEKGARAERDKISIARQAQILQLNQRRSEADRKKAACAGFAPVEALLAEFEEAKSAEARQRAATEELTKSLDAERFGSREADARNLDATKAEHEFQAHLARLASLKPREIQATNLSDRWSELAAWASEESLRRRLEEATAKNRLAELQAEGRQVLNALRASAEAVGVPIQTTPTLRDDCLKAFHDAKRAAEECERKILEGRALHEESRRLEKSKAVYGQLGQHLKTNNFETWLLNRSFRDLCRVASHQLNQLTGGQYSIRVDDKNDFQIVDHVNADETRSVKTLSGGETFLASLSLALALAEQVRGRSLSTVHLDSLFLDEGFGTLDPETLETVARAVEELGASGRMIGVITHVKEFAESLPVRFEVKRGPKGSTIERVTI